MYVVIRDWKISLVTLGSVGLIIAAEAGFISALGFDISIIDAIAFPIILAVAVDGAFWYCKSSRSRDEVRSILLIALVTTLAAVSLSLFSPIKAQRSLGLVMMLGIFLDWLLTRYVLEEFYLSRRKSNHKHDERIMFSTENKIGVWSWPVCLVMLIAIAIASPHGVEVFDINQILPDDDPALDEFEELAVDFGGDITKMETVFANPDKADELKRLNELHPGKEDLFLGNLDSLDILEGDSAYIDVLESDADFFKDVKDLDPDMQNLPPALLSELKELGLTKDCLLYTSDAADE